MLFHFTVIHSPAQVDLGLQQSMNCVKTRRNGIKIIIHARELIHEHTGRDLPIAVTEFNSAYDKSVGGEATPDSHYNAIWLADVLGRMIKNGVFMANEWASDREGGAGGLGLVGQYDVYPAYYTYQLYKKFGNELVYSSSDDPDAFHLCCAPRGWGINRYGHQSVA